MVPNDDVPHQASNLRRRLPHRVSRERGHSRSGWSRRDRCRLRPSSVASPPDAPLSGNHERWAEPEYATLGDERIKALAITHAHEDHVGWIGAGQPDRLNPEQVFVGAPDAARLAHLTGTTNVGALHGGEQISDSVRAIHTPGHTAGHMSYMVESRGERALIFGDVFHSPVQFHDTTMGPWSDENPDQARRSRKLVAELLTEPHTIGVGYHFADIVFGTLTPEGWQPLHL